MEIKFQIKKRVYSLCIGKETQWFEQIYFISFAEEYFTNKEVVYARFLWGF